MQEDDQVPRPAVEDPVELSPEMTPQLTQLSFDLGAVREREMRMACREHVQTVDLVVQRHLPLHREPVDEVVDGLGSIGRPVVDRTEAGHGRRLWAGTDTDCPDLDAIERLCERCR